uniref:CKLF like MARVEL transmembrane domain containing 3 n=1 Tax=Ailuropoda melanoleuca TaxID=9646 RepID=A0A7N5K962_AILME
MDLPQVCGTARPRARSPHWRASREQVTRFPMSFSPNEKIRIGAQPQGKLQPGPHPVVHWARTASWSGNRAASAAGSLQGHLGRGRNGGGRRTRECKVGPGQGPSPGDAGPRVLGVCLAYGASHPLGTVGSSPIPATWCPSEPLPQSGLPAVLHSWEPRAVTTPTSPQDSLRCVTAALIYFAISITAVAKYSDGASKAAGAFGFFATIVFAIDFYLIFNGVAKFLKQGDFAEENTANKAEEENSDSDSD